MRRVALCLLIALSIAACSTKVAEFWRPISEPNILLPIDKGQAKLNFDLSQCRCGIFPTNTPQNDQVAFQPDKQRLVQTGVTSTANDDGKCMQRPSLVVSECMRARGWEVTKCSGRMPLASGGSLCAGASVDDLP